MSSLLASASVRRERKRLIYEFGELLREVESTASSPTTPSRTRQKAGQFLSVLAAKEEQHADEFFVESFLLNFVGESMARSQYLAKPVIEFLKTSLYFYAIDQIERFHRKQSMGYLSAHAELLMDYTGRKGLKELVVRAEVKFEEGNPFCLVNDYMNALKKRYWAGLKDSDDACDKSVSLNATTSARDEELGESTLTTPSEVDRDAEPVTYEDRVQVMLRVFAERLTVEQQKAYLMRHPFSQESNRRAMRDLSDELAYFLDESELQDNKASGWKVIAEKLDTTEKTAKKHYLRALHGLLVGACDEMYDGKMPSGMVRRMLNLLQKIIQERDLRIRDNAGLGLGKIVSRWEVALRFVLNNNRVLGSQDGSDGFAVEAGA